MDWLDYIVIGIAVLFIVAGLGDIAKPLQKIAKALEPLSGIAGSVGKLDDLAKIVAAIKEAGGDQRTPRSSIAYAMEKIRKLEIMSPEQREKEWYRFDLDKSFERALEVAEHVDRIDILRLRARYHQLLGQTDQADACLRIVDTLLGNTANTVGGSDIKTA